MTISLPDLCDKIVAAPDPYIWDLMSQLLEHFADRSPELVPVITELDIRARGNGYPAHMRDAVHRARKLLLRPDELTPIELRGLAAEPFLSESVQRLCRALARALEDAETVVASKDAERKAELDELGEELDKSQSRVEELEDELKAAETAMCDWQQEAVDTSSALSDARDELAKLRAAKETDGIIP